MRINKWLKTMTIALGLSLAALPAYAEVDLSGVNGRETGNLSGIVNLSGAGNIINWDKFNIGENSVLTFVNSADKWAVLNKVTGINPSELLGEINTAQLVDNNLVNNGVGNVFLVNPNGIVFGKDFTVNANTFVASTLKLLSDDDFYKYASGESNTLNFAGDSDKEIKEIIVKGMNAEGYVALIGNSITVDSDVNVYLEELEGNGVTFYAPYELAICTYSSIGAQNDSAGGSGDKGGEEVPPAEDSTGDSGSGAEGSGSIGVIDVILDEMEKEGTAAKTGQQVAQDTKVNGSLSNFIGSQNTEFTVSDNDKKEDEEKSDGTVGGALIGAVKVIEETAGTSSVVVETKEDADNTKDSGKKKRPKPLIAAIIHEDVVEDAKGVLDKDVVINVKPKDVIINADEKDKSVDFVFNKKQKNSVVVVKKREIKLNGENSLKEVAPGVLVLSPVNLGDLESVIEGTPKEAQGEKKFKKVLPASTQKSDMAQGVKIYKEKTKQENELPFTPARETVTNKISVP